MKDLARVLKLRAQNSKLEEENQKLLESIQHFQSLSDKFSDGVAQAVKLQVEHELVLDSPPPIESNDDTFIVKSHSKVKNSPRSGSILRRDGLHSKSASALPVQKKYRQTNHSPPPKRSLRKSRSPPRGAASVVLKKQILPLSSQPQHLTSNSSQLSVSILSGPEKERKDKEACVTSPTESKICVVVILRSKYQEERKKFERFIASYAGMIPQPHSFEWYQGLCSIKKHGDGSHYVGGKAPMCGTWENNVLIRKHHDFLPKELLEHHISNYHSTGGKKIMFSPTPSRRREQILRDSNDRCLFDSMLPDEIKIYIFNFLDLSSLLQAALVSTEWKRLTNDPALWCYHHVQRWGEYRTHDNIVIKGVGSVDWQDAVKTRYLLDRNWRVGDCYASTLRGHSGWVTCVDLHHNRLISSSYDGTVRVWNTQTGNSLQTFPSAHQNALSPVWCVQCKGNTIMSGSSDSFVRQWNMATGQGVQIFTGHAGGVKCLQYNEENSIVLSGSDDKTVKIFDTRSGDCVQSIQYNDSVGNLEYHNNTLMTVIKREGNIYLHDIRTGAFVKTLVGHTKAVYCLNYDPSSNMLVSGSRDRNILLWDVESGTPLKTFTGHEFTVMSLQLDSTKIVSGSGDQTIKIWDVKTGKCSNTLPGHTEVVMSVKFDGTKIVSSSADKTVVVWDFQRRARGR